MAVYNGENILKRCTDSVLNQTYDNFEFIIIDDDSTDNTSKILEDFGNKDQRIRIIENKNNLGQTKSLNRGIEKAKGDFIARIDADDWWENNKLEIQLNFIESRPSYGVVGTGNIEHNEYANKIVIKSPKKDTDVKKTILKKVPFAHSTLLIKKSLLDKYGAYDEHYKIAQDYELYMRMMEHTDFFKIPKNLCHRTTFGKNCLSLNEWKLQCIEDIRIKLTYYKKYNVPLITYLNIIPYLFKLILPNRIKIMKQRLLKILKRTDNKSIKHLHMALGIFF